MAGFFCKILAYDKSGSLSEEPYRGLNGGIAVASVLFFTTKHSWELWGASFNYFSLAHHNENHLGKVLIDSVLMDYKDQITATKGARGQLDFYGSQRWTDGSSAEIGKATNKAIMLIAYVISPLHRNNSREGSAEINNYLVKEHSIG